jgi:hypothetical protein
VKVHVTLKKWAASDPGVRQAALERVLAAGRMTLRNPKRFERHGVITGESIPDLLGRLRALPEVDAVEVDEEEFAGHGGKREAISSPSCGTRHVARLVTRLTSDGTVN